MGGKFYTSEYNVALKTVAHVAICCYSDESRGKVLFLGMKETAERGKIQYSYGRRPANSADIKA